MWPHVRQPDHVGELRRDLAGPAIAVHFDEKRPVAHPAGVQRRRRQQRRARRIRQPQLIEDGPVRNCSARLRSGCPGADRHAGAVAPDQVGAVEPGQRVRVGAQQLIHRGGGRRGRQAGQQQQERAAAPRRQGAVMRAAPAISVPTRRRNASMPLSRWRVGCTRLVSSAQAIPRAEIDPQTGAGEAGMTDGVLRTRAAAGPSVVSGLPAQRARGGCRIRMPASAGSAPCSRPAPHPARRRWCRTARHGRPRRRARRRSRHAPRRAAPGRARCSARWPRICRVGAEARPAGSGCAAERRAGQPLDGDAEQHEIDVGIDRRPRLPDPLQNERAQRRRIEAVGVERLDRRQVGFVAQALAEGQPAFRRRRIVLPQVGIATVSGSSSAIRPAPPGAGWRAW